MNKKIPFVIGITGHRDFEKDKYIDEYLDLLFNFLETTLKHTPVILLSPLADGSDQYVAEKFLSYKKEKSLNWELIVPMPFKKECYLTTIENKKNFNKLLQEAKEKYVIKGGENPDMKNKSYKDFQYKKVGEFIANNSNILIALYDGIKLNKEGGTSKIVEFKREGFKDCVFDNLDGNLLYWIQVERKNKTNSSKKENPIISDNDIEYLKKSLKLNDLDFSKLGIEVLGYKIDTLYSYAQILKELDEINKDIEKFDNLKSTSIRKFYSKVASVNQKKFRHWNVSLILIGVLIVLGIELYHNFESKLGLLLYSVFITLGFLIYPFVNKKDYGKKWYAFRSLSEFLRVQEFWFEGKIEDPAFKDVAKVSKYILPQNFTKWIWLKIAMNGIYICKYKEYLYKKENLEALKKEWVEKQFEYFSKKLNVLNKLDKLNILKKSVFLIGIIASVMTLILSIFEIRHTEIEYLNTEHLLHLSFFVSSVSFLAVVVIEEKFLNNIFLKEDEEKSYGLMYKIYGEALKKIKNNQNRKKIYFCLGKQALYEISKWLEKRSDKKIELPIE